MSYIYRPRGKALEYGSLALNHYIGCSHHCQYCYVPYFAHKPKEEFHGVVSQRNIDWDKFKREIQALPPKSEVFMSFMSDPYQPMETSLGMTRHAIEMFHAHNVAVRILTKSGKLSERDFDLLSLRPDLSTYGTTLTFMSATRSAEWEPHAATPRARYDALKRAHGMGIPTWVSMEPVIDVEESLMVIRAVASFTGVIKIGKWNYDLRAAAIDWTGFLKRAVDRLRELGRPYYIKLDTRPFLPRGYAAEWDGK